jgi:uncharacterized membrane protein
VTSATKTMKAAARLPALDVMRGLVMVLMTVDHASGTFNRGRLVTDSAFMSSPGTPLPLAQFLTRWVTHLCAPTFVLLAGTALALSTESRIRRGDTPGSIDRHIAIRGALLIALEMVWMSPAMVGFGHVLLQVLYALGASFLLMVPLRRLGDRALLAFGLAVAVLDEPLLGLLGRAGLTHTIPVALLAGGGFFADRRFIVGYPVLPWLAIMSVGWVFGRRLLAWPAPERSRMAVRTLAAWGIALLVVFVALRGANGPGNMGLFREDASVVQWLHVSKYPPSVTYDALELGMASLLLAGLFWVTERWPSFASPLRALGQVALFYYLLHIHLMELVATAAGVESKFGVASAWLGAAAVLAALAPLCVFYRRYKAAHPGGWRQYV